MRGRSHRISNDIERLTRIYDARASHWDQREARAENLMVGTMRDRLVRELQGDVLDVGMGTGETLRRLQASDVPVTSYTGVDLSTGMLAQASRYSDGSRFPVRLQQANAESLSMFASNTFDTVTGSLVLCTIPDNEAALQEMARVVKPSGKIVVIEHVLTTNPLLKGAMKLAAPLQVRAMGCHIDRKTDRIIRNLGFSVEQDHARFAGIFHLIVARPPQ